MFEEHLSLFIRAPAAAAQDVATEWSNPVLLSPSLRYTKKQDVRRTSVIVHPCPRGSGTGCGHGVVKS